MRVWVHAALLSLALGCAPRGNEPWLEPADLETPMARMAIEEMGGVGLSGTALDGQGHLWAVAERERVMIEITLPRGRQARSRSVTLEGVPEGLEAESLAWLGGHSFAIGTERHNVPRDADQVLFVDVSGDRGTVSSYWTLDYQKLWQAQALPNQGIEGLCRAGSHLVAAAEGSLIVEGRRFAPVARRELDGDEWTPYLVLLTSRNGKLAALDCWLSASGAHLHVLAVERHYGTARIIHFGLPTSGSGGRVQSWVLVDLATRLSRIPNVEGIVRDGNELLLVTDHDSAGERGTTERILLGPFDTENEIEEAEPAD